jgi:hypothetical protein
MPDRLQPSVVHCWRAVRRTGSCIADLKPVLTQCNRQPGQHDLREDTRVKTRITAKES